MFKVTASPKFWATVEAIMPAENGGQMNVKFQCQFHRLSTDQLEALQERIVSEKLDDRDVAREVMCGWKEVGDEEGAELPYSEAARDSMLNLGLGTPIALTFYRNSPRAKQKN